MINKRYLKQSLYLSLGRLSKEDDEEDENLKSMPKLSAYMYFNKKDERYARHRFLKY